MRRRIWILGAADPEMEAIERLLIEADESVAYAVIDDRRVRAAEAYRADGVSAPVVDGEAYLVECWVSGLSGCRIDHHRPGDTGYGRVPADFLSASSIGQVLEVLGRDPTEEQKIIAAADHCLAAAYRRECPGVDPDALMAWRVASRAAFQGRQAADILADIEAARRELRKAPYRFIWDRADDVPPGCAETSEDREYRDPGHHYARPTCPECMRGVPAERRYTGFRDLRRPIPVPELPEAAARDDEAYISGPLVGPDGQQKYTCSGRPEAVEIWLDWASGPGGLVDVYGDPARGFAGGYRA